MEGRKEGRKEGMKGRKGLRKEGRNGRNGRKGRKKVGRKGGKKEGMEREEVGVLGGGCFVTDLFFQYKLKFGAGKLPSNIL